MNRQTVLVIASLILAMLALRCSGGGGSNPVTPVDNTPLTQAATGQLAPGPSNTCLMGYYDVYFDIEQASFEIVENRTTAFTLNIVPFLNLMTIPKNGITLDQIVLHQDDPSFLGVDVVFTVYHPFPGYQQYNAYDLRGIIIGDGSETIQYGNLRVPLHGADLWMKNPDGYTRWMNPTDFTSELIFGYAPGGWQNHEGSSQLNPYKWYGKHLDADDNLWSHLTLHDNFNGIFENGYGRKMELEFPLPPDGIGIMFGYAVVVSWEDQGPDGPFSPFNLPEAIACSASQTPDVWYNEMDGSGGSLILDVDLFGWDMQPSTIKIESSVLDGIAEFDAEAYGSPVSENVSTYHVEAPAGTFTSTEGHEYWVIAEYGGYDYSNDAPGIPHADGLLAAFFRYDCVVLPSSPDCPIPVPTAISGSPALNNEIVTETVTSTNLHGATGIAAYLDLDGTIDGVYDINGTDIQNVNVPGGTFDATFDLNGQIPGDYFVVVTNACGETGASTSPLFTIEDACPEPKPEAITGSPKPANGVITETITSTNLMGDTGLEVYLDMDGNIDGVYDITGFDIENVDVDLGTFDASFDITGAALGWYYVIVTNACGETGVSDELLFEITEYLEGDIYVSNHPDFDGLPEYGTMENPYHTINAGWDASITGDLILVDYGTGLYKEALYVYGGAHYKTIRAYNWHSPSGRPLWDGPESFDRIETIDFSHADYITIRGFKITWGATNDVGWSDIVSLTWTENITFTDCFFTGTVPYDVTRLAHGVSAYWTVDCVFENCLFRDINVGVNTAETSIQLHAFEGGWNINLEIAKCEFAELQPDNAPDGIPLYVTAIDIVFDWGGVNVHNNLIHHLAPTVTNANMYLCGIDCWAPLEHDTPTNGTGTIAHNTIDEISSLGISNFVYCWGIDNGNVSSFEEADIDLHSNIVTNILGESNHYVWGIGDDDVCDYSDIWNVKRGTANYPWDSAGSEGEGCIYDDPMYENNMTEPYDYHLQAGSPAEGTGKDGNDMGCYGNLADDEVVGLLGPED